MNVATVAVADARDDDDDEKEEDSSKKDPDKPAHAQQASIVDRANTAFDGTNATAAADGDYDKDDDFDLSTQDGKKDEDKTQPAAAAAEDAAPLEPERKRPRHS